MNVHVIYFEHPELKTYNFHMFEYVLRQSVKRYMPDANYCLHKIEPPDIQTHHPKITSNYVKLLKQLEIAENEKDNYIFIDCDMVLTGDISPVFDTNFDIAFTETTGLHGNIVPINAGLIWLTPKALPIVRKWVQVAEHLLATPEEFGVLYKKHKGICQSSLGEMFNTGFMDGFNVHYLPCSEYNMNFLIWQKIGWSDSVKCIHYNSSEHRRQIITGSGVEWIESRKAFFQYRSLPSFYEKEKYNFRTGYAMNIENPKTLNEKIAWKKHNDRNPLIALTADKLAARDYVRDKGHGNILTEILYSGYKLPSSEVRQGYLKVTHASQRCMKIVKGMQKQKAINKARAFLNTSYGANVGEWCYQAIRPRVFIEKAVSDSPCACIKALCFHGVPEYYYYIEYDHAFKAKTITLYDKKWIMQDVRMVDSRHPVESEWKTSEIQKPSNLDYIEKICGDLSSDFDFVRVDLMINQDKVYFSELTHYPTSGMMKFNPPEWDEKLGSLWTIDEEKTIKVCEYIEPVTEVVEVPPLEDNIIVEPQKKYNRRIFIDLGAHKGSVINAVRDQFDKIYAFECNKNFENYDYGDKVEHVKKAAWIKNCDLTFNVNSNEEYCEGNSLFAAKTTGGLNDTVTVQGINFSSWLKKNVRLDDYVVVKMNMEGAEYPVLKLCIEDNSILLINELHVSWHYHKIPTIPKERHKEIIKLLSMCKHLKLYQGKYRLTGDIHKCGLLYLAFGEDYNLLASKTIRLSRKYTDLPICVITNLKDTSMYEGIDNIRFNYMNVSRDDNRNIKTMLPKYTPFNKTIYLDCDCIIQNTGIENLFVSIETRIMFLVKIESFYCKEEVWPVYENVAEQVGEYPFSLYHGAIMGFSRTDYTKGFFQMWNEKWKELGSGRDQPALAYAANKHPINKVVFDASDNVLGHNPANKFALVQHERTDGMIKKMVGYEEFEKYKPFNKKNWRR